MITSGTSLNDIVLRRTDSLSPRLAATHKGTYGHVAIIAGSPGRSGAAVMSARGAIRMGAGLVTVMTDAETAKLVTGRWVDPRERNVTVAEWCDLWLAGYQRRPGTVKQARVHVGKIVAAFGPMPLGAVRPSDVRSWLVTLADAAAVGAAFVGVTALIVGEG